MCKGILNTRMHVVPFSNIHYTKFRVSICQVLITVQPLIAAVRYTEWIYRYRLLAKAHRSIPAVKNHGTNQEKLGEVAVVK